MPWYTVNLKDRDKQIQLNSHYRMDLRKSISLQKQHNDSSSSPCVAFFLQSSTMHQEKSSKLVFCVLFSFNLFFTFPCPNRKQHQKLWSCNSRTAFGKTTTSQEEKKQSEEHGSLRKHRHYLGSILTLLYFLPALEKFRAVLYAMRNNLLSKRVSRIS